MSTLATCVTSCVTQPGTSVLLISHTCLASSAGSQASAGQGQPPIHLSVPRVPTLVEDAGGRMSLGLRLSVQLR